MELKRYPKLRAKIGALSFNRTSMELKLVSGLRNGPYMVLLIGPVWN